MTTENLCPLCGEGHVTAQVEQVENEYKGHTASLPQHYSLCDQCGSDFVGATEARLSKRALMAWRKQIDGLLTGQEILALRQQYKLTQAQAAQLFGGGPVAFSKYENDDVAQSESMDTLLRLVRRCAEAFWALVDEKHLSNELKRPVATVHKLPSKSASFSIVPTDKLSAHYAPKAFRHFKSAEGKSTCTN
jgi:HTH-type transcriptional regulator / antitoxin MqsA